METKPFNLQSPEQIAKDYGGNKQKIAEAMQLGIIDPTAGTMAAMFIDRMRSAAQAEAAPQQTVAQKVFAPPQMPAGLGATPQAAAMPAPPVNPTAPALPPAGLGGLGGAPQAPVGMAMGGLTTLPLPDNMFDEPDVGGYAGGGIVAFATGREVEGDDEEIVVEGSAAPESYYGFFRDPEKMKEALSKLYTPDRTYSTKLMEMLTKEQSPEAQKKRSKEDMWMALGQIGAKMASTPGSLLQAASAGIGEALPGIAESAKARRAEQREAIKTQAQLEGLNNKEALDMAKIVMDGTNKYGEFDMARLDREQRERMGIYEQKQANYRARVQSDAQSNYLDKQTTLLARQVAAQATGQLPALRSNIKSEVGLANNAYLRALSMPGAQTKGTPQYKAAQDALANLKAAEDKYVQQQVQRAMGGVSGLGGVGMGKDYGTPPEGSVVEVG